MCLHYWVRPGKGMFTILNRFHSHNGQLYPLPRSWPWRASPHSGQQAQSTQPGTWGPVSSHPEAQLGTVQLQDVRPAPSGPVKSHP